MAKKKNGGNQHAKPNHYYTIITTNKRNHYEIAKMLDSKKFALIFICFSIIEFLSRVTTEEGRQISKYARLTASIAYFSVVYIPQLMCIKYLNGIANNMKILFG